MGGFISNQIHFCFVHLVIHPLNQSFTGSKNKDNIGFGASLLPESTLVYYSMDP